MSVLPMLTLQLLVLLPYKLNQHHLLLQLKLVLLKPPCYINKNKQMLMLRFKKLMEQLQTFKMESLKIKLQPIFQTTTTEELKLLVLSINMLAHHILLIMFKLNLMFTLNTFIINLSSSFHSFLTAPYIFHIKNSNKIF